MKPVVLLTGATGGIGQAIADELKEDFAIAAWYHMQAQQAAELKAQGKVATIHQCDLADTQQITRAFQETLTAHNSIDVLINCAGKCSPSESFADEENTDEILRVNYEGPICLTRLVYREMQNQKRGTIVNIGSTAGVNVYKRRGASVTYSAAKADLINFTRVLAYESSKYGIVACVVSPGSTKTPMTEQEAVKRYIAEKIRKDPSTVVQSPEVIARVVGNVVRSPKIFHGKHVVIDKNEEVLYELIWQS